MAVKQLSDNEIIVMSTAFRRIDLLIEEANRQVNNMHRDLYESRSEAFAAIAGIVAMTKDMCETAEHFERSELLKKYAECPDKELCV